MAHFLATQQRLLDAFDLETIRSRPIEFTCCTGLDELCLVPFGIEWMRQLIARLGMDEATVLRLTHMTPLI